MASRVTSCCDKNLMTCAAASWPIDIITAADFSRSVRLVGLSEAASVTGNPFFDYLGGAGRIIDREHAHALDIGAEHILDCGRLDRRPSAGSVERYRHCRKAHPRRRLRAGWEYRGGAGTKAAQHREYAAEQHEQARQCQEGIVHDRCRPLLVPPPRRRRPRRGPRSLERKSHDRDLPVSANSDHRPHERIDRFEARGRNRLAEGIVDGHGDVQRPHRPDRMLDILHGPVDVVIGHLVAVERGRRGLLRGSRHGAPRRLARGVRYRRWRRPVRQGAGDADGRFAREHGRTLRSWLRTWPLPYVISLSFDFEKSRSASTETRKLPRPRTGANRSVTAVS